MVKDVSIIIPVRNEERLIGQTIEHVLAAGQHFVEKHSGDAPTWELVLVDNGSTDATPGILSDYGKIPEVKTVHLGHPGAARARNAGRTRAVGRTLVFVDADTTIPVDSLWRIAEHCDQREHVAGITRLGSLDGGVRSRLWWNFWNQIRRLPLPRAKAMPACMFCSAATFDHHGPFDEDVAIGEEWPILAGLYRKAPHAVIYDHRIIARSSSRRMDQILFGYTRTFAKYAWAVLHRSGRIHYTDQIR